MDELHLCDNHLSKFDSLNFLYWPSQMTCNCEEIRLTSLRRLLFDKYVYNNQIEKKLPDVLIILIVLTVYHKTLFLDPGIKSEKKLLPQGFTYHKKELIWQK